MNRRSLLLGSVVASVAGILGVKAETTVIFKESWDNEKSEYSVMWDELRNTPEYQEWLDQAVREAWVRAMRLMPEPPTINLGYARLEPHPFTFDQAIGPPFGGGPPAPPANWRERLPEPHIITEKYAKAWEQFDPLNIYPTWRGGQLAKVIESTTDDTDS